MSSDLEGQPVSSSHMHVCFVCFKVPDEEIPPTSNNDTDNIRGFQVYISEDMTHGFIVMDK